MSVLTRLPSVTIDHAPVPLTLVQARHDTICTPRSLACVKGQVRIIDGAVRGSRITAEAFARAVFDQLLGPTKT